jgi:hypothetical protein
MMTTYESPKEKHGYRTLFSSIGTNQTSTTLKTKDNLIHRENILDSVVIHCGLIIKADTNIYISMVGYNTKEKTTIRNEFSQGTCSLEF